MDIDLPPKDYRSDREKPHEPFFGSGAKNALGYALGWLIVSAGVYLALHGHF